MHLRSLIAVGWLCCLTAQMRNTREHLGMEIGKIDEGFEMKEMIEYMDIPGEIER